MSSVGSRQYASYLKKYSHYIIEGQPFMTVKEIYIAARDRGYQGTLKAMEKRIWKGARTWKEILVPAQAKSRKAPAAKREEVSNAIAAVEARKAEIAARAAASAGDEEE